MLVAKWQCTEYTLHLNSTKIRPLTVSSTSNRQCWIDVCVQFVQSHSVCSCFFAKMCRFWINQQRSRLFSLQMKHLRICQNVCNTSGVLASNMYWNDQYIIMSEWGVREKIYTTNLFMFAYVFQTVNQRSVRSPKKEVLRFDWCRPVGQSRIGHRIASCSTDTWVCIFIWSNSMNFINTHTHHTHKSYTFLWSDALLLIKIIEIDLFFLVRISRKFTKQVSVYF